MAGTSPYLSCNFSI